MFPQRVGRVILDGVVDATRVATTQSHKVRTLFHGIVLNLMLT